MRYERAVTHATLDTPVSRCDDFCAVARDCMLVARRTAWLESDRRRVASIRSLKEQHRRSVQPVFRRLVSRPVIANEGNRRASKLYAQLLQSVQGSDPEDLRHRIR